MRRNINQMFNAQHGDLIELSRKDDCPANVFIKLYNITASNAHYYLEEGLKNKNLKKETLIELYESKIIKIQKLVAENEGISNELIKRIINDKNPNVLTSLASNKCLNRKQIETIIKLSIKLNDPYIMYSAIRYNKNLCLEYIINHQHNLEKSYESLINLEEGICSHLSSCDKELIDEIYQNCKLSEAYLVSLIDNDKTSLKILKDILKKHKSTNIILALAKNNNIDEEIIQKILKTNNKYAISLLIDNNRINNIDTILKILEDNIHNKQLFDSIIKYLKNYYFESTNTSIYEKISVLDKLSLYNNNDLNTLIASYKFISRETSIKLFKDGSHDVIKKLSENCKHSDILMLIGSSTSDIDIYCNTILNDIDNDCAYVLFKSKLLKDLLLSNHPKKNKVYKKYQEFKSLSNINLISKLNKNSKEEKYKQDIANRLKDYFIPNNLSSNTSLIQLDDNIEIKDNLIIIKPDNIDLILSSSKRNISDRIIYGDYPQKVVNNRTEIASLNILYSLQKLNQTGKKYRIITNTHNIYSYNEYEFNSKKYIRYINNKNKVVWVEVLKIKWKINEQNKTLEALNEFIETDNISLEEQNDFANRYFKKDILEPYKITKEELEEKRLIEKNKQKSLAKFKLVESSKIEEQKFSELSERIKNVVKSLEELKLALSLLETSKLDFQQTLNRINSSIQISDELLIKKVDDHFEFNEEFIPLLKYIDLSFIDTKNLKLSGLDLSETNIHFNPQLIYNKDLSGTKLADHNVSWVSFKDVNLQGADISEETDSYEIEYALIDDNTKLPIKISSRKI